jgi:hypothetical protein
MWIIKKNENHVLRVATRDLNKILIIKIFTTIPACNQISDIYRDINDIPAVPGITSVTGSAVHQVPMLQCEHW